MVEAGYQTIKSQVEEKVVPHIPTNISESVSKNMSYLAFWLAGHPGE